jgi:hypothetical protein
MDRDAVKLLKTWSGRRGSNPRRPAWEAVRRLSLQTLASMAIVPDHRGPWSFRHLRRGLRYRSSRSSFFAIVFSPFFFWENLRFSLQPRRAWTPALTRGERCKKQIPDVCLPGTPRDRSSSSPPNRSSHGLIPSSFFRNRNAAKWKASRWSARNVRSRNKT